MKPADAEARPLGVYATAVGLSVFAAVGLLQLSRADLRVPFDYGGDALLMSLVVKSVVDYGWYWSNPSLGAPFGFELRDYPFAAHDSFHVLLIKMMSCFTHDWALLFNLYFLLGFPLITLSAMAVFRHFRVGYRPAIVGAVLYSFLPSRLLKGEGHLFLDSFYQVPLAILIILWVCDEHPPLVPLPETVHDRRVAWWPGLEVRRRRSVAALLICGLVASTSLYYAFFTTCLLAFGGVWASIVRGSMRNVVAGFTLAGAIVVGMAANGLPTIVHHVRHGPNAEVGERLPWEAETYGMKIAQLLLPVDGHRLPALRRMKDQYNERTPLGGENGTTSLGLVGDVGFLLLLGAVLTGWRSERSPDDLWRPLAALNLVAVLLGTIGGFGSLFAWLVSPQIRGYSRLGVFIGFFALFAVVLLLDRIRGHRPRLVDLVLPVILVVGLLDQVTPLAIRPYAAVKKQYASDANLVHRIEASFPGGMAIFELPYMTFPEPQGVNDMPDYGPLRPYLHSRKLRWSYPAMRGRGGDAWARDVSEREPGRILEALADAGFGGVLVDRSGYVDRGAAVEAEFRTVLGNEPIAGVDGRLVFFDLAEFGRRLHEGQSRAEIELRLLLAQHPLALTWASGFYDVERAESRAFRWCQALGELRVTNDTALRRTATVRATLVAAHGPARLTVLGDLLVDTIELAGGVPFVREIEVPPGDHVIRFACDGRPADAPTDPRTLVWRVENFALAESSKGRAP
jgi:phosphoglycerol transferase